MGILDIYSMYKRYPMIWLTGALIAGIAIGTFISGLQLSVVALIVCLITLFITRNKSIRVAAGLCLVLVIGCQMQANAIDQRAYRTLAADNLNERPVCFRGLVQETSQLEESIKIRLRNIELISDSLSRTDRIDYYVYVENCHCVPVTGDTLIGLGTFYTITGCRNPGDFDFRAFYHKKGVFGRIYPDRKTTPTYSADRNWSADKQINVIRTGVKELIFGCVPGKPAGLLTALILGDKTAVDPEVKSSFVETGVVHVLAVSGLHVGYVVLILLALVRILRIPWGLDKMALVLGLIGFIILTGFRPSVVRASIMAGLYILAPIFNRSVNTWNIIAGAAFIILAVDPGYLSDLGFQMSFLAVISIIYFYNLIERILPDKLKVANQSNTIIKTVWGLFLVSLSAQIGTLPLTAYHFGRIPVIALVANIFVVPLIGVLVALGFSLLLLGWIPYIGAAVGNSIWLLGKIVILLTDNLARIPFATISIPSFGIFELLIYVLLILALFLLLQPLYRIKALIVALLAINLSIWKFAVRADYLDVIFMDVGQGDAIIITSTDYSILIDAGERYRQKDMGERVVLPVARHLGIDKFELIVMTHPHNDHIGGIPVVLDNFAGAMIWDTRIKYDSRIYDDIHRTIASRGLPLKYPQRGEIERLNDYSVIQVFCPDTIAHPSYSNVNNSSIVLRLVHGNNSFLFTGDLEYDMEPLLYSLRECLDSRVLKVAHHGSKTGTTAGFINTVDPEWAIISVGHKNKFNHPSSEIIERLEAQGITVRRTDHDRAIWLRSDGYSIREIQWQ